MAASEMMNEVMSIVVEEKERKKDGKRGLILGMFAPPALKRQRRYVWHDQIEKIGSGMPSCIYILIHPLRTIGKTPVLFGSLFVALEYEQRGDPISHPKRTRSLPVSK